MTPVERAYALEISRLRLLLRRKDKRIAGLKASRVYWRERARAAEWGNRVASGQRRRRAA